jgi:hypothetical protein
MADPAAMQQLEELAGFPIVPGTLNLLLAEAPAEIAVDSEAHTGQAGYFLTRVTIAE